MFYNSRSYLFLWYCTGPRWDGCTKSTHILTDNSSSYVACKQRSKSHTLKTTPTEVSFWIKWLLFTAGCVIYNAILVFPDWYLLSIDDCIFFMQRHNIYWPRKVINSRSLTANSLEAGCYRRGKFPVLLQLCYTCV